MNTENIFIPWLMLEKKNREPFWSYQAVFVSGAPVLKETAIDVLGKKWVLNVFGRFSGFLTKDTFRDSIFILGDYNW